MASEASRRRCVAAPYLRGPRAPVPHRGTGGEGKSHGPSLSDQGKVWKVLSWLLSGGSALTKVNLEVTRRRDLFGVSFLQMCHFLNLV